MRDPLPKSNLTSEAEYDFGFRPETYWPRLPTEETVLSQVKGSVRRAVARHALEGGEEAPEGMAEFLLEPELDDASRELWGSLDPRLMGGEYLPEMTSDEVEIANIALASVTFDVIQVRAQPDEKGIVYRVVDEYEDEGSRFQVMPERSTQPLSLGELIDLIDESRHVEGTYVGGLFESHLNAHIENGVDVDELIGFITVTSAFYLQLAPYYGARLDAWLAAHGLQDQQE